MALIDKASLLMVPSTYEDGTLYNILPSGNKAPDKTGNHNGYDQTRADFTFSRGSNLAATRVNASGLIEKGRENLLTYSNTFSDSDWVKADTSVTSGQADKDGGTNAWLLAITGAGGFQTLRQTKSVSGVNTISIYAKANALNWMRIINGVSSTYFDILNGVVGTDSSIGASIESAGNGFFRCSIPFSGAGSYVYIYPATGDGNVTQSSGSIYIQNAQLEAGLVATDYIETGATTATAGVLENTPRIDYSSGAGALLLESQRTNLSPYSEYLSGWNTIGTATFTTNHGESPEGVNNAMRFQATSAARGGKYYTISVSSGTSYTLSFYAKSLSGTQKLRIGADNGCSTSQGAETFEITETWKRIDTTISSTQTSWNIFFDNVESGSACTGTYLNVDMLVYGFQVESASYPSSYVPTYGSAATRGADSCSVTGVSDVIGQTEGVFLFEIGEKTTESIGIFEAGQGSSQHRFLVYTDASKKLKILVVTNYAVQVSYTSSVNVESNAKIAIAYKANDYAIYLNGSQLSTDTSASVPPMNQLAIGSDRSGIVTATNNIKQATLFNERLTNAELATLTTL